MTTDKSGEVLRLCIERQFNASVETVFEAWTRAHQLSQWFAPTNEFTVVVPVMDVHVGGKYRLEMTNPAGETHIAIGEYIEVTKPEKLVFTWGWEGGDSGMLVTIDLTDRDGKTELVLTHERFPDAGSRDHHNDGWTGCMNCLDDFLKHT